MGGFLRNALTGCSVAEDGEIFLSLEDTSAPKVEVKKRKPRTIISNNLKPLTAVSYTHLTLPTKDSV